MKYSHILFFIGLVISLTNINAQVVESVYYRITPDTVTVGSSADLEFDIVIDAADTNFHGYDYLGFLNAMSGWAGSSGHTPADYRIRAPFSAMLVHNGSGIIDTLNNITTSTVDPGPGSNPSNINSVIFYEDINQRTFQLRFFPNLIQLGDTLKLLFRPMIATEFGDYSYNLFNIQSDTSTTPNIAYNNPPTNSNSDFTIFAQPDIEDSIWLSDSPTDTSPISNFIFDSGSDTTLYCWGKDQFNNYIGKISADWSVDDTTIVKTNTPGEDTIKTVTALATGTTTLNVASVHASTSLSISVSPGPLNHLVIRNAADGNGNSLIDTITTLTSDGHLPLFCAGYDSLNNYIQDFPVHWTKTGNLDSVTADSTDHWVFNPYLAPTQGVFTASLNTNGSVFTVSTDTVYVTSGALARLEIWKNTSVILADTVVSGNVQPYIAMGFDQDGNQRSPENCNWTYTNSAAGSLSSSPNDTIRFTALQSGSGTLTAYSQLFPWISRGAQVVVVNNNPSYLIIRDGPGNSGRNLLADTTHMTTDQTLIVFCALYDALDNYIGDALINTWSLHGTTQLYGLSYSSDSLSVTFSPSTTGLNSIQAKYDTIKEETQSIIISSGHPTYLSIEFDGQTTANYDPLIAGQQRVYKAIQYDAENNRIGPVPSNWTLSPQSRGNIVPDDNNNRQSANFTALKKGSCILTASILEHPEIDASMNIFIVPGTLDSLTIHTLTDLDLTQTRDSLYVGQSLMLQCLGYDSLQNALEPPRVRAAWSSTGTLDFSENDTIQIITYSPQSAITRGTIIAEAHRQNGTLITAETDSIIVFPGLISYVQIQSDSTQTGNPIIDDTLTSGESLPLFAVGYDLYGNFVGPVSGTWSMSSNIGQILPSSNSISHVRFKAGRADVATIRFDYPISSNRIVSDPTGNITVLPGAPIALDIRTLLTGDTPTFAYKDTITIDTGEPVTLHCVGVDSAQNFCGDVPVQWELLPGNSILATNDTSYTFSSNVPIEIRLQVTSSLISDTSGVIQTAVQTADSIKIQWNPSDSGAEVDAPVVSAGDTLKMYSVGYDSFGNYYGLTPCNWGEDYNNRGQFSDSVGVDSIVYIPMKKGTVILSTSKSGQPSVNDQTGTITINPGRITSWKILDNKHGNPSFIHSIVQGSQQLRFYSAGYDTFSNFNENDSSLWRFSEIDSSGWGFIDNIWDPVSDTSIVFNTSQLWNSNISDFKISIFSMDSATFRDSTHIIHIIEPPSLVYDVGSLTATIKRSENTFIDTVPHINLIWLDSVSFQLKVYNTGSIWASLNKTASYLRFLNTTTQDTFKAYLKHLTTVSPDTISGLTTLEFNLTELSYGFAPGDYTPILHAAGLDQFTNNFVQELSLEDVSVNIVKLMDINFAADSVTVGQDSIVLDVTYRNFSDDIASVIDTSDSCIFYKIPNHLTDSNIQYRDKSIPAAINPNQNAVFQYDITIPRNIDYGQRTVTAQTNVNLLGLNNITVSNPAVKDTFLIQNFPSFTFLSLSPDTLTAGSINNVRIELQNSAFSAPANIDSVHLSFFYESNVVQDTSVIFDSKPHFATNGQNTISINNFHFRDDLREGDYHFQLLCYGRETNGDMWFCDSIFINNTSMYIRSRPRLQVSLVIPTQVSKGDSGRFQVTFINPGGDTAHIDSSTFAFGQNQSNVRGNFAVGHNGVRTIDFPMIIQGPVDETLPQFEPSQLIIDYFGNNQRSYRDTLSLDTIRIDKPAELDPDLISLCKLLNPDSISIGSYDTLFVVLYNRGTATAIVTPDSIVFTDTTGQTVNGMNQSFSNEPLIMPGLNTDTLLYRIHPENISWIQRNQTITASITLTYIDANSSNHDFMNPVPIDTCAGTFCNYFLRDIPRLEITSFTTSVDTVVEKQTIPWTIMMGLRNTSPVSVYLDTNTTRILFEWTSDPNYPTSDFQSQYVSTNQNILLSGETDEITFTIFKTGKVPNNRGQSVRILGYAFGYTSETQHTDSYLVGDSITISNPKSKRVRVLTKGQLSIKNVFANQATVDSAQAGVPRIPKMVVVFENRGEAPLELAAQHPVIHVTTYGIRDDGYLYSSITESNRLTIPGNFNGIPLYDSLSISFTRVGDIKGSAILDTVDLMFTSPPSEPNQTEFRTQQSDSLFTVQSPACLYLDSLFFNNNPSKIIAGDTSYSVYSTVHNFGEGRLKKIGILLDSEKNLSETLPTYYQNLSPPDSVLLKHIWELHSNSIENFAREQLTCRIDSANTIAFNTGATPKIINDFDSLGFYIVNDQPPIIQQVRFIDGGYTGVPNGVINLGDVISILFDKPIQPMGTPLAQEAFSLICQDSVPKFGRYAKIYSADDVGYTGSEKNRHLFIVLDNATRISTNSSSNLLSSKRKLGNSYPTLLFFNPNVNQHILEYYEGAVALDLGSDFLQQNLKLMYGEEQASNKSKYSVNSILVDDHIPPFVLHVFPNRNISGSTISAYSPVKAIITGRNLIYLDVFTTELEKLFKNQTGASDSVNSYIASTQAPKKIIKTLNQWLNSGSPWKTSRAQTFIDHVQTYYEYRSTDDAVILNPLAQMYTQIDLDNKNLPLEVSYANNDYMYQSMKLDSVWTTFEYNDGGYNAQLPAYTIIASNGPLPLGKKGDQINIKFWAKSIIYSNQSSVTEHFKISIINTNRNNPDCFIWAAPNPYSPFDGKMTIEYGLDKNYNSGLEPEIVLLDEAGEIVKSWKNLNFKKGRHRISGGWDGNNGKQMVVGRGLYLLYFKTHNTIHASWVVVVK